MHPLFKEYSFSLRSYAIFLEAGFKTKWSLYGDDLKEKKHLNKLGVITLLLFIMIVILSLILELL